MPLLPALTTRAPAAAPPPHAAAAVRAVRRNLDAGLPARIDLDATRSLVLGLPLGRARAVLAADPLAVVFDTAAPMPADPGRPRDTGGAWPRLTLVAAGTIGESVPVVAGVPFRLRAGGAAVVAVTVERLRVTAGSLRSPGRFGSVVALGWRDLGLAPDSGPPPAVGDPSIPRSLFPDAKDGP